MKKTGNVFRGSGAAKLAPSRDSMVGGSAPITPKTERLLGVGGNSKRLSASSDHLRQKLRQDEAMAARKKKARLSLAVWWAVSAFAPWPRWHSTYGATVFFGDALLARPVDRPVLLLARAGFVVVAARFALAHVLADSCPATQNESFVLSLKLPEGLVFEEIAPTTTGGEAIEQLVFAAREQSEWAREADIMADNYMLKVEGLDYFITQLHLALHRVKILQICTKTFVVPRLQVSRDSVLCLPVIVFVRLTPPCATG